MISQLDQTIKKLLDDNNAPKELKEAEVSFDIPKEGYAPDKDTVNLFLYDVLENRKLRDPVPIYKIVDGEYQKRKPPIRVDCSYMLTAWNGTIGETSTADEHRILSQALIWLSRFPIIPKKYLSKDWKDETHEAYQPFDVYMIVAQMNGVKEPGEFWSALGSTPRPFINVAVTITMDMQIPKPAELGPPISKRKITTGQKEKTENKLISGTEEVTEYVDDE